MSSLHGVMGTATSRSVSAISENRNYNIDYHTDVGDIDLQSGPLSWTLPHPMTVQSVPLVGQYVGDGRHTGAVHWFRLKGSLTRKSVISLSSVSGLYFG